MSVDDGWTAFGLLSVGDRYATKDGRIWTKLHGRMGRRHCDDEVAGAAQITLDAFAADVEVFFIPAMCSVRDWRIDRDGEEWRHALAEDMVHATSALLSMISADERRETGEKRQISAAFEDLDGGRREVLCRGRRYLLSPVGD